MTTEKKTNTANGIFWQCEICGTEEFSHYVQTIALKRHCRECAEWIRSESSQTQFLYIAFEHALPVPYGVDFYLFEKIRILKAGGFESYYIKQSIADSIELNCDELATSRDAFVREFQYLRNELTRDQLADVAKDSYSIACEIYKLWKMECGEWGTRND